MMPEYPYTTYQGYALVNFDVNEEGNLKNISAVESKCAISRNDDGSIEFRNVLFLKLIQFKLQNISNIHHQWILQVILVH